MLDSISLLGMKDNEVLKFIILGNEGIFVFVNLLNVNLEYERDDMGDIKFNFLSEGLSKIFVEVNKMKNNRGKKKWKEMF